MKNEEFEKKVSERREQYNAQREELKQMKSEAYAAFKKAKANAALYIEVAQKIDAAQRVVNAEYHAGNIALQSQLPKATPESRLKRAAFSIQRSVKAHTTNKSKYADVLDLENIVVQFSIDDFGIHVTAEIPKAAVKA